ncbi:hypothetical protein C4585_00575 [Candidatus Parcubacteria bacterium]|nr:MAG: hypothetical protein C4585_00575 [Candidatus Parcubacteria bacterium]
MRNEEESISNRYAAPRRQRTADRDQWGDIRGRARVDAHVERRFRLEEVFPGTEDSPSRMAQASA